MTSKKSESAFEFQLNEFQSVIKALHEAGALRSLVLIGSWCQQVYRETIDQNFPLLTTSDIDFFIPQESPKKIDVAYLLKQLGFEYKKNYMETSEIFTKPNLDIQFLTRIKRVKPPIQFKSLNLLADPLEHTEILTQNLITLKFRDVPIRLPRPEAFALHKIFISTRRKAKDKKLKDRQAAVDIIDLLTDHGELRRVYSNLSRKEQKTITSCLRRKDSIDRPDISELLLNR